MNKGYITISVPNNTTQDEIKEIRRQFNESRHSKEYKLNIIIGGTEDMTTSLSSFLMAKLK